jgi:hypothetical protein
MFRKLRIFKRLRQLEELQQQYTNRIYKLEREVTIGHHARFVSLWTQDEFKVKDIVKALLKYLGLNVQHIQSGIEFIEKEID